LKIAIFGAWRTYADYELHGNIDQFAQVCYKIGAAIAKHGHSLIVAGDGKETADYHVVLGFLSVAKDLSIERPMVDIVSENIFYEEYRNYPHLFTYNRWVSTSWKIAHLYAIKAADSVFVIGGGSGSYQAGIAGFIANKRVVPVGTFGGAARQLLDITDTLAADSRSRSGVPQNIGILRGPYTSLQHDTILNMLGVGGFPTLMIIHGRSADWQNLRTHLQEKQNLSNVVVMGQDFGAGRTLPEKYEDLALHVDGAIAIATPDDSGAAIIEPGGTPINDKTIRYFHRARQNVWLEVGWFWGYIGRKKILILHRGGVEIPSDLEGVEGYEYSLQPSERSSEIQKFIQTLWSV
jgi:hypothetical protein